MQKKICNLLHVIRITHFSCKSHNLYPQEHAKKASYCLNDGILFSVGYLLDPHTAIAKFVADLVNDGDVPMIINATAHCSKFAPQVLRALGHKKEIKDKTVSEMFDMLHKITESPSMHSKLEECVKSSSINEKVLKPNYEDIEREIKIFSHKI